MEYNILLVDDKGPIHKLLPLFLAMHRRHTFKVHSALHGEAGVKMYHKLSGTGQKPDIVLMDIKMPVVNGVEATKRIMDYDPEANIYLFTAYANTEVEQNALNAGARGTISKSAEWSEIVAEIVNILESASASDRAVST